MDRRNFLKTGGIALLGSLTTGSAMALATPGALGGEGADKKATVALAMNLSLIHICLAALPRVKLNSSCR